MHRAVSQGLIIALMLSGAAFAQSQSEDSLGDIARANRARQQAQQADGVTPKVVTNQDLPGDTSAAPEKICRHR